MLSPIYRLGALSILASLFAGCSTVPTPSSTVLADLKPGSTSTIIPANTLGSPASVDSGVTYIDTGADDAFALGGDADSKVSQQERDRLSHIALPPLSLNEKGVFDAFRLIAGRSGLALVARGGATGAKREGSINLTAVQGNPLDVIETLSVASGLFYHISDHQLIVEPTRRFVMHLPPAIGDDTSAGIASTIQALGVSDLSLDRVNRTLSFQASRTVYRQVEEVARKVREQRVQLMYDIGVYQVDFTNSENQGINWNALGTASLNGDASGTFNVGNVVPTAANTGNMFFGTVLNLGTTKLTTLVEFLRTQGKVKTISQPRLAFLSGSGGEFKNESTTEYVSKVGTTATTGVATSTVDTKTLHYGVQLKLTGDYHANSVYSQLALKISDLSSMKDYKALDLSLSLPQTEERSLNTEIQGLPGQSVVLGGIRITRSESSDEGAPITDSTVIPSAKKRVVRESELVLVLTPRVYKFRSSAAKE